MKSPLGAVGRAMRLSLIKNIVDILICSHQWNILMKLMIAHNI